MRKFTKGLLMTLVASAMSVGASAQVALDAWEQVGDADGFEGYFRVINVGYLNARGTGVMNVTSPNTAQPQAKQIDAITMPGTVMYINASREEGDIPTPESGYNDYKEGDYVVFNLRSQAVDASAAVYSPMVQTMKKGFAGSLKTMNRVYGWNLTQDELDEALNKMFFFMKMYLEKTEDSQGNTAFYLKSTTPDPRPLANLLKEKGIEVPSGTRPDTEWLWDEMFDNVKAYCDEAGEDQLWTEWEYFFDYELSDYTNRIHMGHTYYLIGGHVKTNFRTHTQKFDMGPVAGEFISFANENKVDYPYSGYTPEIEVAGDFSKWYLEPIVPGTETETTNYFALNSYVEGLDGHFYQTLYTDFPMEIVDNGDNTVRVWGIQNGPELGTFGSVQPNPGDIVGYVVTKEYTGVVPARTPVVVECKTTAFVNNLLNPAIDEPYLEEDLNKAIQDETDRSFLRGIFFPSDFDANSPTSADNNDEFIYYIRPVNEIGAIADGTAIKRVQLRVFNKGKNTLNPLGFFKYNGKTVKANQAFMILEEDQAYANSIRIVDEDFLLGISEVNTENTQDNVIYDIQGRRVMNPTKGLYIVNGKKMVK
ncbi:MAG: hypothetical protein J5548_06315 [Prevotella sp.]|nr:hypothetical protein [Prevotella sp.]